MAENAMTAMTVSWRNWLGGMAAALALTACAGPAPPLMSPLQVARNYGYSEVPIGDGRYRVSYLAPYYRTLRSPRSEDAASNAARTQALDFALWRAAQIATAQGYSGFSASNVRTDVKTVADDSYDPIYGPWYGPGFGPGPNWWGPSWASPYWGPSPYVFERVEATVEVELKRDPGPGDYDARDVVAQLRQHYPGAESAAVQYGAAGPPALAGVPSGG
jgi:hypothetical protein